MKNSYAQQDALMIAQARWGDLARAEIVDGCAVVHCGHTGCLISDHYGSCAMIHDDPWGRAFSNAHMRKESKIIKAD